MQATTYKLIIGRIFSKPSSFPLETMYVSSNQFIAKIKLGFLEQKKNECVEASIKCQQAMSLRKSNKQKKFCKCSRG